MIRLLICRYLVIALFFSCFSLSGAAYCDQQTDGGSDSKKMYTAYNIWLWPSHNMVCLNFKGARKKIPVGTEVQDVKIAASELDAWMGEVDHDLEKVIQFVVAKTQKKYVIRFVPHYHPGKTIQDYLKLMFTNESIDDVARQFDAYALKAIKEGAVIQGMSKKAVLASFGPPSERHTRGLEKKAWIYFTNKKARLKIHFLRNELTNLDEVQQIDVLHGRASRIGLTSYPRPVVAKPMYQHNSDPEYKLRKIKELYDKGLITQEEYQAKRQQIMDQL